MGCARASKASRELLDIERSVTYLHAQPKKQGCLLIQFCDIDARMRQYRYLNVCVRLPLTVSLAPAPFACTAVVLSKTVLLFVRYPS